MSVRRVCFTLHNYGISDQKRIWGIGYKYCIIGFERCPETGRPHLQGFVSFQSVTKFNTAKKLIGEKAHIEKAKGTDEDNRKYCSKTGDYCEDGTPAKQGERNDLKRAAEALVKQGGVTLSFVQEYPTVYIKYHRGLEKFSQIMCPPARRVQKTAVYVFVGLPGAGKSLRANREALERAESKMGRGDDRSLGTPSTGDGGQTIGTGQRASDGGLLPRSSQERGTGMEKVFYKQRGEWWDGYKQQPFVIIDDFYGWLKYDELLKICDRYPYRVPVKGSFEEFNSEAIWITSNITVDCWYKFPGYDPAALMRRITRYINFTKNELGEYIQTDFINEHINY